jgi:hypothetical protein
MAYVLHSPVWLVGVAVGIFGLILAVALVFGWLERLFGKIRKELIAPTADAL